MLCARAAHPHLKRGGVGRVINNGSMLSIFGMKLHIAYAASKGGIVQLTKSLATAWAADGITVNAILPGWIDTALTRKAREDMPALDANVRARAPMGRWGDPADFEGIAAFLASSEAGFVTGTAIPVDGGYSVQG
jgi:2-deoxy-D-gluconate 3-dehydrogenase